MINRYHRFLKFLFASGIAAVVNIVARIILSIFISYELAIIIAYAFGMITAYLLSKFLVFEQSGQKVSREILGFIAVNMIALIQVWGISVLLYRWVFPLVGWEYQAKLVAHVIGVASPAFTSYFGHKYISFGQKRTK